MDPKGSDPSLDPRIAGASCAGLPFIDVYVCLCPWACMYARAHTHIHTYTHINSYTNTCLPSPFVMHMLFRPCLSDNVTRVHIKIHRITKPPNRFIKLAIVHIHTMVNSMLKQTLVLGSRHASSDFSKFIKKWFYTKRKIVSNIILDWKLVTYQKTIISHHRVIWFSSD